MTDLASAFERAAIVRQRLAAFAGRAPGNDLGNSVGVGLDGDERPTVTMPLDLCERLLNAAAPVETREPAEIVVDLAGRPLLKITTDDGAAHVGRIVEIDRSKGGGDFREVHLATEDGGRDRFPLVTVVDVAQL